MAFLDRFRRRAAPTGSGLELAAVVPDVQRRAAELVHFEVEPPLLRARLYDALRDAGVQPPAPERFDRNAIGAEPEDLRRALLLTLLVPRLPGLGGDVVGPLMSVVAHYDLHEMELLARSTPRVEELCRGLAAALSVPIAGETPARSAERLVELDYRRLLSDVARAREEAAEQVEHLKKLHEARRPTPRSKW